MSYIVTISQAGGEYQGNVTIKGKDLKQLNINTVIVDGIEITFESEYIMECKNDLE